MVCTIAHPISALNHSQSRPCKPHLHLFDSICRSSVITILIRTNYKLLIDTVCICVVCVYHNYIQLPLLLQVSHIPLGTHLELIAFALGQSLKDFADQHRLLGVDPPIDPLTVRTVTGWPRHYIVLPQSMQCTAGGCVHHDQGPVKSGQKGEPLLCQIQCIVIVFHILAKCIFLMHADDHPSTIYSFTPLLRLQYLQKICLSRPGGPRKSCVC